MATTSPTEKLPLPAIDIHVDEEEENPVEGRLETNIKIKLS